MRPPLFVRLIAAAMLTVACHSASSPAAASPASRPDNNASPSRAASLPPGFTALQIAEGDSLFNTTSCWRCHGMEGRGTANGPTFRRGTWQHGDGSIEDIVRTIQTGVPLDAIQDTTYELEMNANPSKFTPPQIRSVAAYVWSLSRARVVKKREPSP